MSKTNAFIVVLLGGILGEMTWSLAQSGKKKELTIQDYIEIQQLYARYNFAIDANEAENMTATFTDDGEFYAGTVVNGLGHDGILKFMRSRNRHGVRHWNSGLVINGTQDQVKGAVYLLTVNVEVKPPALIEAAKYDDTLVKTPQGWRFKKRVVNKENPPGTP
jgi:SnoaL-like protein